MIGTYPTVLQVVVTPYTAKSKVLPKDSVFDAMRKHDEETFVANEFCIVSHHTSLLAGVETIFDKSNGQKQSCTDCHGKDHRINIRTIRWNKATGEQLEK